MGDDQEEVRHKPLPSAVQGSAFPGGIFPFTLILDLWTFHQNDISQNRFAWGGGGEGKNITLHQKLLK